MPEPWAPWTAPGKSRVQPPGSPFPGATGRSPRGSVLTEGNRCLTTIRHGRTVTTVFYYVWKRDDNFTK